MTYYFPILLTVFSNVFYHIFLKLTPGSVNPIISLTITYAIAMVATMIIYPFYPSQSTVITELKSLNWASYALGVAIVGLEIGFLLAYRMGWQINMAGIISNIAVALVLIPIGLFFFKESLSTINLAGLFFCLLGLILVNYKA